MTNNQIPSLDDYTREALEIVKSQAKVRAMSVEEITAMVRSLAGSLRGIEGISASPAQAQELTIDPKTAVKEKSIACLECGKTFKVLTKKHIGMHGLTPAEYREKHGLAKKFPLVCKSLQRDRRKKMKEMELWKKREKNTGSEG